MQARVTNILEIACKTQMSEEYYWYILCTNNLGYRAVLFLNENVVCLFLVPCTWCLKVCYYCYHHLIENIGIKLFVYQKKMNRIK